MPGWKGRCWKGRDPREARPCMPGARERTEGAAEATGLEGGRRMQRAGRGHASEIGEEELRGEVRRGDRTAARAGEGCRDLGAAVRAAQAEGPARGLAWGQCPESWGLCPLLHPKVCVNYQEAVCHRYTDCILNFHAFCH